MTRHVLTALAALALAGCSCGPAGGSNTSPVKGVIVGRVVDSITGQAIASVAVKAQADTLVTALTDADGVFVLKDMPLGTLTVTFDLAGYVRALCTPTIDVTNTSQGNVLARCDMVMARADARLEGIVVTPDGKPVQGMGLTVDLRSLSGPALFSGYDLVATATTAADGSFAFAALPSVPRGLNVGVTFPPWDLNGDSEPEVPAFTRTFSVYPGAATPVVVVLSSTAPQIVVSNLTDNELGPSEAATVTWNTPLDTASAQVQLVDDDRNIEVPLEVSWMSNLTLNARPANGTTLRVGTHYYLSITAKALGTDNAFGTTWTLYFTARPSTVNAITAQVANLAVTSPITPAHSSTTFTLAFTGAAGAAGYKVYAKDALLNPGWVLATAFNGSSDATVYRSFTLPTQFDVYQFDGATWPLANGNRITFAVVPFDAFGNESPLSAAPTVQVQDGVPPSWVNGIAQVGDAVNDTAQPVKVTFGLTFSEPMKASVAPQLITASGLSAVWAWAADYQSGVFTITIPANSNGAEGLVVRGGEDQNGNKIGNGELSSRLTGIQDFLVNPGFEDGSCSLTGWTPAQTGGLPTLGAAVAQANTYAVSVDPKSRCAAALGSINGSAAGFGSSRVSQQFTVPVTLPAGRPLVARVNVRTASDTSPTSAGGTTRCAIMDSAGTGLVSLVMSGLGNSNGTFFNPYSSTPTLIAGTTYQAICEVALPGAIPAEFGMWVDDFQVGVGFF